MEMRAKAIVQKYMMLLADQIYAFVGLVDLFGPRRLTRMKQEKSYSKIPDARGGRN